MTIQAVRGFFERLGNRVTSGVWQLGFAARFFAYMVLHSGTALRRFSLTVREIYFSGVLSLIIILVSGLFVGMVLGLQGYHTLERYGSSEALEEPAQRVARHLRPRSARGRRRTPAPGS